MDWLTFGSSLVSSLAWPTAVVILGLALRRPLVKLLPTLRKAKYGELEVEFGLGLERAKEELASAPEPKQLPPPSNKVALDIGPDPTLPTLESVTAAGTRDSILKAWIAVEMELANLAKAAGVADNRRPFQTVYNIRTLRAREVIGWTVENTVEELRRLRNLVVHTSLEPQPERAVEYAEIARRVTLMLRLRRDGITEGQPPGAG